MDESTTPAIPVTERSIFKRDKRSREPRWPGKAEARRGQGGVGAVKMWPDFDLEGVLYVHPGQSGWPMGALVCLVGFAREQGGKSGRSVLVC